MPYFLCTCIYKTFADESVSTWSTILELLISFIIGACGVILNYVFLKKLQAEKRSRLLGRKGNVVEPVMSWFCVFQIIYWPYYLLYFWILFNGIIPSDYMNGWWCSALMYPIKFGRFIIGYNSFFVAFIRYLYIVHQQKSNQWEFARVAKIFQISSFVIPLVINLIETFTNSHTMFQNQSNFKECIAFYQGVNTTDNLRIPVAVTVAWTMKYVPEWIIGTVFYVINFIQVIALFNILEGFLYLQIYRSITR
jgi:hypothetical protein